MYLDHCHVYTFQWYNSLKPKIDKTLKLNWGKKWLVCDVYKYRVHKGGCCNRCLSPLMLWVRILLRARCTTLCDKVCRWLSPGTPISPTNRIDCHDRTEILLKVALNTIKPNNQIKLHSPCVYFFSGGDITICKCDWVIGGFWRSSINNDRVRYYCCHSVAKING